MGGVQTKQFGGFRVCNFKDDSLGILIGLERYFDYIVGIDGVPLTQVSDASHDFFIKRLKNIGKSKLNINVYNSLTTRVRTIILNPCKLIQQETIDIDTESSYNNDSNISFESELEYNNNNVDDNNNNNNSDNLHVNNGINNNIDNNSKLRSLIIYQFINSTEHILNLGIGVHWEEICSKGIKIINVQDSSPAQISGLISNSDYIIGSTTLKRPFYSTDDFLSFIKNNDNVPIIINIYNTEMETLRDINIIPNSKWGGKGLLGCDIAAGPLYDIPLREKKIFNENLNSKKYIEVFVNKDNNIDYPLIIYKLKDSLNNNLSNLKNDYTNSNINLNININDNETEIKENQEILTKINQKAITKLDNEIKNVILEKNINQELINNNMIEKHVEKIQELQIKEQEVLSNNNQELLFNSNQEIILKNINENNSKETKETIVNNNDDNKKSYIENAVLIKDNSFDSYGFKQVSYSIEDKSNLIKNALINNVIENKEIQSNINQFNLNNDIPIPFNKYDSDQILLENKPSIIDEDLELNTELELINCDNLNKLNINDKEIMNNNIEYNLNNSFYSNELKDNEISINNIDYDKNKLLNNKINIIDNNKNIYEEKDLNIINNKEFKDKNFIKEIILDDTILLNEDLNKVEQNQFIKNIDEIFIDKDKKQVCTLNTDISINSQDIDDNSPIKEDEIQDNIINIKYNNSEIDNNRNFLENEKIVDNSENERTIEIFKKFIEIEPKLNYNPPGNIEYIE